MRVVPPLRRIGLAAVAMAIAGVPAAGLAASAKGGGGALLPGSSSKEPVSIDAAKLDYFDKEQKLVYSGDVVAKQGDSTLKAAVLTIYLDKAAGGAGDPGKAGPGQAGPGQGAAIDRMEAKGPVTVISKDEVGTGDAGSYSKAANTITLTGNVKLTQAANIITGDRLVYDMTSGQAQVSGGVRSVFTPQSSGAAPGAARKPRAAVKAAAPVVKPEAAASARTP